jgi:hypothetical protein
VVQDEIQITEPARTLQEGDAIAAQARLGRGMAPQTDNLRSLRSFGGVALADQRRRDPGAAHLVFLAELAFASRADDGNANVAAG